MADAISGISDRDLVARVRAGDSAAFEQLFDALYPELVSLCATRVRDDEAAKDLVCGIFADLFFRRSGWEPAGMSVRAYFVRAVLNRTVNFIRDVNTSARNLAGMEAEFAGGLHGGITLPPDAILEERETIEFSRDKLDRAFLLLPPRYGTVINLRWQQELSFSEIAQVLDVNEAAARKLLSRAMQRLKEVLEED